MNRILFMHHVSTIGGGSYCLLNLIKAIDRTLWEPYVVLKSNGPLEVEFRRINVPVLFFPQMATIPYNKPLLRRASLKSYYKIIKSLHAFKRLLSENEINTVYINNMMLHFYLRPAKECKCKTVLHVREHWPLDEHKIQLKWARNSVNNYADKLITINKYSASMFPSKNSTIVYDWIDMGYRYKAANMESIFGEECSDKIILLYNGGMQMIKGLDYIVNAFSEHIHGDKYRMLLIGVSDVIPLTGWRHYIKMLLIKFGYNYFYKRMVDNIKNDKRIKCIPPTYEIEDYYLQSTCYVSYFRIPHANLSLAENLYLKKPCIAADNEEAREYSQNGEFAMLVKPNNYLYFAENLKSFLYNIDYWRKCAGKGSIMIKDKFDKNYNIENLNKALESLA